MRVARLVTLSFADQITAPSATALELPRIQFMNDSASWEREINIRGIIGNGDLAASAVELG
jgi:hypothetical protein